MFRPQFSRDRSSHCPADAARTAGQRRTTDSGRSDLGLAASDILLRPAIGADFLLALMIVVAGDDAQTGISGVVGLGP